MQKLYFSMYCINELDTLHVLFFSASCMWCLCAYLLSDVDVRETGVTRCWTRTQRPFQPCSSHQTTSHWLWWRGWHSSGCDLRLAVGWFLSPSSWNARWSLIGPPSGHQSLSRWCPARCAPRGRCSGARSCRAGRSRHLTQVWPDCLLWQCSHHQLRGRSSSQGQRGNTFRGPLCLADKLREKSEVSLASGSVNLWPCTKAVKLVCEIWETVF